MTSEVATSVIDSAQLCAIRERDRISAPTWFRASNSAAARAIQDRRTLLALLDDIIAQAREGAFIEHECPALFACTYIIAQTCEPSISEQTEQKG